MFNIDISTLMLFFFIVSLVISIWKIYAFLPNKELVDDDTTKESTYELIEIMLRTIELYKGDIDKYALFEKMKDDVKFDKEHYWHFNQNRLNQLLNLYYIENKDADSIKSIYTSRQVV